MEKWGTVSGNQSYLRWADLWIRGCVVIDAVVRGLSGFLRRDGVCPHIADRPVDCQHHPV